MVFAAFLVFIGLFFWWRWVTGPLDRSSQAAQIFVIPPGQGIDTIAKRLKTAGLIRSASAFKITVVKNSIASRIQAGDFRLRPSMDLETIAQELTHGTLDVWVTLLEGWRREEIAHKLEQEFVARDAEFNPVAFLESTRGQEGYLFPDTYLLPRDASATAIAAIIRGTFDKKVDLSQNQSGLTSKQVIIIASIIEREVRTDQDRPLIAGILIKRLQNDWPLQADATVQYAIGTKDCRQRTGECDWWKASLTKADLTINSPYNTYQNQGLPPAPIANPGLASINAALTPQSSDSWFYLSDLKGQIHYAQNIEGHNANIRTYLNK